jgi:hypothetical protein
VRTAEDLIQAFARTSGDLAAARRLARSFDDLPAGELDAILWTGDQDVRLVSVLILVQQFRSGSVAVQADILDRYLVATHNERLDDAQLIDVSAEHIVGAWFVDRNPNPLFALAKSDVVWDRRVALTAALAFVKRGDAQLPLQLAERLARERGAVVQEALGLLLREVGKRASEDSLRAFLDRHGSKLGSRASSIASEHLG